jgi:hypothetical protein
MTYWFPKIIVFERDAFVFYQLFHRLGNLSTHVIGENIGGVERAGDEGDTYLYSTTLQTVSGRNDSHGR